MEPLDLRGSDGLAVRDSGLWAKEKLYYLQHYLDIFSVGMKNRWAGELYYVDLFAGPGKCRVRETGEEVDGSPLIALRFNFAKYFLFESDPTCHEALTSRVRQHAPGKLVQIFAGDCNEAIVGAELPGSGLGLAFIDPTGLSPLAFDTLRKLATNRKIDLIINFHEAMGIRMNIHQHTRREGGALDSFVGSARWRENLGRGASLDDICREITGEFQDNLRVLGYDVVDRNHIPIKAAQNALLYYLIFASKHPRGNEFWRKVTLINAQGQRRLFE